MWQVWNSNKLATPIFCLVEMVQQKNQKKGGD